MSETKTTGTTDTDVETVSARSDQSPPGSAAILRSIVAREVWTAVLTPTYVLLGTTLTLVVLGIAWASGGIYAGYVPTTVDLLTPLELLVPVVAVAFGYRAILSDERSGELDVLETYPVSSWHVVLGIYVGRAIGIVFTVAVPLLLVMLSVGITSSYRPPLYATHTGADSPGLFLRFVVLTVLFALVILAVALAVSALVSTTRTAIAVAGVVLLILLFGTDLALVYGFGTGLVSESNLIHSLALSPLSAYRGLVLETAVVVASGTGPQTASPLASILGLLGWGVTSLAIATLALRR